jgi:acetyl-CoA carboxylase biotin carboxyl carrier protein
MKLDDVKSIVELMTDNGLTEFEMEENGVRISIKKGGVAAVQALPAVAAAPAQQSSVAAPPEAEAELDNYEQVKAPFVGTFYRAPAPDAEPYVKIGMEVEPDTVLCIIEAMKVMNELKAEMRGVVRAILADNAQPVQYGQPLFKIEKT